MPSWIRAALALFAVGWGANQFAALLPVYEARGAGSAEATALFGAYAVGLIPALLVVAPLSDRLGRRRVLRPVLVLSFVATVVLMVAGDSAVLLLLGRVLAGVASGAAFAPGTAWVKELSAGPDGTGARRAAIALTAGFGTGPLVSGVVGQWAPHPTVLPYVPHLLLTVVVCTIAWRAPEPVRARHGTQDRGRAVRRSVTSARFLTQVLPTAPWVFGTATLAFAALPAVVAVPGPTVAMIGVLVALTLGTGILLQPLGRRLSVTATLLTGGASGVVGFVVAAGAAAAEVAWPVPLACVLLGAAYGLLLVGGLRTVEQVAHPSDLATVNAVFYSLTYIGFSAPLLATLLVRAVPGPTAMLIVAGLLAACLAVAVVGRRHARDA